MLLSRLAREGRSLLSTPARGGRSPLSTTAARSLSTAAARDAATALNATLAATDPDLMPLWKTGVTIN